MKSTVERALAGPKFAPVQARLRELIPDASPEGFWIRAAMTFGEAAVAYGSILRMNLSKDWAREVGLSEFAALNVVNH